MSYFALYILATRVRATVDVLSFKFWGVSVALARGKGAVLRLNFASPSTLCPWFGRTCHGRWECAPRGGEQGGWGGGWKGGSSVRGPDFGRFFLVQILAIDKAGK